MSQSPTQIGYSHIHITMMHSFSYLDITTLCCTSRVCKEWYHLIEMPSLWKSMNLSNYLPLTRFDAQFWENHIDCVKLKLDPSGAPPFVQTKTSVVGLQKLCKEVYANQGITDLTLPKGLSLKTIELIAKNLSFFKFIEPTYGKTQLEQTLRIFITNAILRGSKGRCHSMKKGLYANRKTATGHEKPAVLHLTTLTFLRRYFLDSSQTHLHDACRLTFACCSEPSTTSHEQFTAGTSYHLGFNIYRYRSIMPSTCGETAIIRIGSLA